MQRWLTADGVRRHAGATAYGCVCRLAGNVPHVREGGSAVTRIG